MAGAGLLAISIGRKTLTIRQEAVQREVTVGRFAGFSRGRQTWLATVTHTTKVTTAVKGLTPRKTSKQEKSALGRFFFGVSSVMSQS
jgi:hypothetical protein